MYNVKHVISYNFLFYPSITAHLCFFHFRYTIIQTLYGTIFANALH